MCVITDNLWAHSFLMKDTIRAFFSDNFENNNKKTVRMKKYQYLIGITVYRELLEILADYGVNPTPKAKLDQGDLRENYLVEFINKCGNVDEKTKNDVISHVFSHLTTDEGKKVRDKFSVKNYKQTFKLAHKRLAGKYSVLELLMNTLLTNLTVMKYQNSLTKTDMGQFYPLTDTYKIDKDDKNKAAPASRRGSSNERENYTSLYNLHQGLSLRQTLQVCFIKKYTTESTRLSPEEKRKVVKRLADRTRAYTLGDAEKDLVPKKSNRGRPNSTNKGRPNSTNNKRKGEEQEDSANDAENNKKPGKNANRTKRAKSVETMDDNENSDTKSAAEVTTLKSASESAKKTKSKKMKLEDVRGRLKETLERNDIDSGKIEKIMDDLTEIFAERDLVGITFVNSDDEGSDEEDDEVDSDDEADEQDGSVYDKIKRSLAKVDLKLCEFYDNKLRYSTDEYQQKLCVAIVGRRNNKTGKTIRLLEMSPLFGSSSEEDDAHLEKLLDCAKKAKCNAKVKMYTFTNKDDEFSLTSAPATIGDEAATNEISILRDVSNEEEDGILEYFLLEKIPNNCE